jgi:hypothetical protein
VAELALGIVVSLLVLRIEGMPFLSFTTKYQLLNAVAIGR